MAKQYASSNFNRRWFISHRGCDSALAELVEVTLQELEQNTILDTYDFLAGQNFKFRMSEASKTSDHTICILTENFFTSDHCEAEFNEAFAADPENWHQGLVIIMAGEMKDEDIPEYARDLIYIDFRHRTPEEMVEILKLKIPAILRETQRPDPDLQHEILVIFAKFRELGKDVKSNPGWRWATQLRYEQQELLASEDIGFIELKDEIENEDQAYRLLKNSGAQMIIWGDVDDDFVGTHYSFNIKPRFNGLSHGLAPRSLTVSDVPDLERGWVDQQTYASYMRSGGDTKFSILFLLGMIKQTQQKHYEAVSYFTRCTETLSRDTLSDFVYRQSMSQLVYLKGISLVDLGNYESAIDEFDYSLISDPLRAHAYLERGYAKGMLGDFWGEVDDCNSAINLGLELPELYNNRGYAKEHLEDYAGAKADFDVAIKLRPSHFDTYIQRAQVEINLGNYLAAIADCSVSIELQEQNRHAFQVRAVAKTHLEDYQGALADFDIAIGLGTYRSSNLKVELLDKLQAWAYSGRGFVKSQLGDYSGSIVDYDNAIVIYQGEAQFYLQRGLAKHQSDDFVGAISDYDAVMELGIEDVALYHNRADAKAGIGDYMGAIEDADRAISLDPNCAEVYQIRAEFYRHLGNKAQYKRDKEMYWQLIESRSENPIIRS